MAALARVPGIVKDDRMLQIHCEGGITVLTLDRPKACNALSRELAGALRAALDDASCNEAVSAVILASSHPRVFIAGGDLDELTRLPMSAAGAESVLELGTLTRSLEACAVPVIAAVGGAALGGGAEVIVACDLVVMGADASVRFVHSRMGLVPAWGGATRLEERIGALRANELLLTARSVGADEAFAMGLCNRRADEPLAAALALAESLLAVPRGALAALKQATISTREARRGNALAVEREAFRRAWGSPAHRAAFTALARSSRTDDLA